MKTTTTKPVYQKVLLTMGILGTGVAAALVLFHSAPEATAKSGAGASADCIEGTWLLRFPDGRIGQETIIAGKNGQQIHFNGVSPVPNPDSTIGGMFPNAQDFRGGFVGSAVRTGPGEYFFRSTFQVVNVIDGKATDVAYIGIDDGIALFPDCNTQIVTLRESYYLPEQDADNDGIPDEGEEPFLSVEDLPVTGKKLTL